MSRTRRRDEASEGNSLRCQSHRPCSCCRRLRSVWVTFSPSTYSTMQLPSQTRTGAAAVASTHFLRPSQDSGPQTLAGYCNAASVVLRCFSEAGTATRALTGDTRRRTFTLGSTTSALSTRLCFPFVSQDAIPIHSWPWGRKTEASQWSTRRRILLHHSPSPISLFIHTTMP